MKNKLRFFVLAFLLIGGLTFASAAQSPIVIPDGEWMLMCNGGGRPAVYIVDNLIVSCNVDGTATAIPMTVTITPSRTPAQTPTRTATTHPTAIHASPIPSTATVTATVTATPTGLAQRTPTKSSTPLPSPTPVRTQGGNIQPYASAPLCPTHNDTEYHPLWDSVRGCHYDHTHNDDPALGDPVFGAVQGQELSYPWMTPNENDMMGHGGYKYYVNLAPQPACATESFEYLGSLNCVSAFRIQYHEAGGSMHMVKRFHSYYLEAQVKKGNIVGIVRTGGWADFGCLHGSYKDFFITLPGIDPTNSSGQSVCGNGQDLSQDPYRSASTIAESLQSARSGVDNFWSWTSTTASNYGYNKIGSFFYRVLDASGGMDAADPYAEHPICPDSKCKYNNSEQHMYTVMVNVPASLDTNRDGIVNYTGYTDRRGNIVQGCTAPSLDCIPLQIINAPVGQAIWARNLSGLRPAGEQIRDNDVYFNGQPSGWIKVPTP